MNKANTFWLMLGVLAVVLGSCSDADSLGGERPREVVIQGVPSWENGMQDLIALKCAYCHAVPRPDVAPATIPDDLDMRHYETRVVEGRTIRGADSLGAWIFAGILNHPVTKFANTSQPRQMPLGQGTQLTDREKGFFEHWSQIGVPRNQIPDPPAGDVLAGAELWLGLPGCVDCHDLGMGIEIEQGLYLGPPIRPAAVTNSKIKSMWLHKISTTPLSDQQASDIRAFLQSQLGTE